MSIRIVTLVVAAAAAGFLAGRWTASSDLAGTRAEASAPSPAPPATSPTPDPRDAEIASLHAMLGLRQETIRALELKLVESAAQENAADDPDPMAVPAELWGLARTMRKRPSGDAQMRAMKLISSLKPDHAAYFITRFKEARDDPDTRRIAFEMVLTAGGPDAADFSAELLRDPGLDGTSRSGVLAGLVRMNSGLMPSRLALTESLARVADHLIASADPSDRAAAAAILGMKARDGDVEHALRNLVENDPSDVARRAAIFALARGGSSDTQAWLKEFQERPGLSEDVAEALRRAIGSIELR